MRRLEEEAEAARLDSIRRKQEKKDRRHALSSAACDRFMHASV